MTELERLYKSFYGCYPEKISPLTGSASNRRYFRMSSSAGTCIGVSGTDSQENDAFLTIARHLKEKGIAVPVVHAVSPDGMYYIQEDLGQAVLFDEYVSASASGHDMEVVRDLLCRTMSLLPLIQFEGAAGKCVGPVCL